MGHKTAENYVNYQERATEFAGGDIVVPFGNDDYAAGRVTAVWPAIGMIDVEFPIGNKRYPAEDLARINPANTIMAPPLGNSVPGGQPTVSVPGGPESQVPEKDRHHEASTRRVAEAFVKKALYWQSSDRKYRATQAEVATGHYRCPKCRSRGIEATLRPASYKRREGVSEKLLGCGECLFLVKFCDIVNCPGNEPVPVVEAA